MNDTTIGFIAADIICVLLVFFGVVLTIMYWHAYRKMKRSPMIRSVWLLMLAITIDSAFFAVIIIASTFHEPLEQTLVTPQWLLIPKIVFLLGLLCFTVATLSPNTTKEEKVEDIEEASDCSSIRR